MEFVCLFVCLCIEREHAVVYTLEVLCHNPGGSGFKSR
jgi:hypothetical protein